MEPVTNKVYHSWNVPSSQFAKNTFNPIRSIVDGMKLTPNPEKDMIALSIGDPTVFGNMTLPDEAEESVIESVKSRKFNGYGQSFGIEKARAAIAEYSSKEGYKITAKDVILTSGCSGALDLCIACLCNPEQNLLIPRPGFSIYKTLAESHKIIVKDYNLLPNKSWQVDLEHLESLIDDRTAAIVVNNPSNPCGSVYNKEHLIEILNLAEKYKIPIIADEIYEHFVYSGNTYYPIASLTETVPVLSCSGLTKRFIVPGWRLGWIIIFDKNDVFEAEVRQGLISLSQRILGPSSIVQGAVEGILAKTPQKFFEETIEFVETNAKLFYNNIVRIAGLHPVMPQGAMYMMIGIEMEKFPEYIDDVAFTEALVREESVFCLPAKCFQYPGFFRVVLTVPRDKLSLACDRIAEFCTRHYSDVGSGGNVTVNGTN
ncbi:hypothetical protein CHS0354_042788 [Potamilus streckersoni]|uniref:Tyrosine aminotransferase n=1 Tax=Potamilus streckersoni TaxID=2493646 RepID=A0AAE0T5K7_9BIVA|nr:hypothetical protein CHS0354_042788 [Potamilus streckersoni]